tara:strand:+ start:352 stop:1215 length:864 start_codon:yes stop_codon:yes gene_type:complete
MTKENKAEQSLTDAQRDACLERIDQDSYVVLPVTIPQSMIDRANDYIDAYCAKVSEGERSEKGMSETNIVEHDPVFREFLLYKPALQLSYDVIGPMFHLGQDKWTRKYRGPASIQWHSDGPQAYPEVGGRCPLHTLRFGYFMSDAMHNDSGTLEVIRGSHRKKVLHAQKSIHFSPFSGHRQDDFVTDHVTVKGKAGTIIAFHNAIWHRAPPNKTDLPRTIVYFQYCHTMMHPLNRDVPYSGDMSHFTDEERWLLGEPRPANSWVNGNAADKARMGRFCRSVDESPLM